MTWIFSEDGTTVDLRRKQRPGRVWVQTSTNPPQGHYVDLDDSNAAEYGWYPHDHPAPPDADHVRSVERQGDRFVDVWTFDQTLADSNAAETARQTERAEVRDSLNQLAERSDGELVGGLIFDLNELIAAEQAKVDAENQIIDDPASTPILKRDARGRKQAARDQITVLRGIVLLARNQRQLIRDTLEAI